MMAALGRAALLAVALLALGAAAGANHFAFVNCSARDISLNGLRDALEDLQVPVVVLLSSSSSLPLPLPLALSARGGPGVCPRQHACTHTRPPCLRIRRRGATARCGPCSSARGACQTARCTPYCCCCPCEGRAAARAARHAWLLRVVRLCDARHCRFVLLFLLFMGLGVRLT